MNINWILNKVYCFFLFCKEKIHTFAKVLRIIVETEWFSICLSLDAFVYGFLTSLIFSGFRMSTASAVLRLHRRNISETRDVFRMSTASAVLRR